MPRIYTWEKTDQVIQKSKASNQKGMNYCCSHTMRRETNQEEGPREWERKRSLYDESEQGTNNLSESIDLTSELLDSTIGDEDINNGREWRTL